MTRYMSAQAEFDWGEDRLPSTPLDASLMLELDVASFSAQDTSVPPEHRGERLCAPAADLKA